MRSAAVIRKKVLSLMQDVIIPDLEGKAVRRLIMAGVRMNVPPDIHVRPMTHAPLREEEARKVYPLGKRWDSVQMHSMRFPVLVCVTEGEADIQVGVTNTMLGKVPQPTEQEKAHGGYVVSLAGPGYLLLPPHVPVAGGNVLPWDRPQPHTGTTTFVYLQVLPVGALCQLMTMKNGVFGVDYSLFIEDPQLAPCMGILLDEMSGSTPNQRIAQAQMLTLLLRIQRSAQLRLPVLTDGLYSRFPEGMPPVSTAKRLDNPVLEKAHQFIQLHLHEPLTPALIAAEVRMTAAQLNLIFRRHTGLSIMGYVTRMRMETSQLLLRTSSLSVLEISRLVGFRQQAHFSRTFHSYTGASPLKFRQQQNASAPAS